MSNFAARLAQANVGDIKTSASNKLADSMAAAQKKESKWRGLSSLIKTGANLLMPGVGGFLTSSLIDPIGRKFGAGADRGDIQLDENYQIFGGREAIGTARQGLTDNISNYKQKSFQDALVGFGESTAGGAMLEKWGGGLKDSLGFGGGLPNIGTTGAEAGNYADAVGDLYNPAPPGTYAQGGMVNGFLDKLLRPSEVQRSGGKGYGSIANKDSLIDRLRGEYYTDQETGITDLGKSLATPWEQHLRLGGGESKYFDDESSFMESLGDFKSKYGKLYEQGGMVQKYEKGGQIARQTWRTNQVKNEETGQMENVRNKTTVYDTYDYDGINWNKTGTSNNQDPQRNIMTKAEMDNYRSEDRTKNVGSQYMEGTSEVGINEFLKTPATAALVDRARSGDEGAMENLIEMLRQQRPEMADKSNEELRLALGKTLTSVDLYGQGYQDVLGKTDQTLSGMNKGVQGARAGMASQAATSGIRTGTGGFKGESSLSEGLYNQVGQEYKNMQRGIQDEFEGSFGGLESSFLTDFG